MTFNEALEKPVFTGKQHISRIHVPVPKVAKIGVKMV